MAFESKLTKSSRSTDFRISPSICTMFNVMVDAKDQSAKLCAMEMGQEVTYDLLAVLDFNNVRKRMSVIGETGPHVRQEEEGDR
jgi:magnesium-transporting ATPase (P-type)